MAEAALHFEAGCAVEGLTAVPKDVVDDWGSGAIAKLFDGLEEGVEVATSWRRRGWVASRGGAHQLKHGLVSDL
jgi:hypothetical protein